MRSSTAYEGKLDTQLQSRENRPLSTDSDLKILSPGIRELCESKYDELQAKRAQNSSYAAQHTLYDIANLYKPADRVVHLPGIRKEISGNDTHIQEACLGLRSWGMEFPKIARLDVSRCCI